MTIIIMNVCFDKNEKVLCCDKKVFMYGWIE